MKSFHDLFILQAQGKLKLYKVPQVKHIKDMLFIWSVKQDPAEGVNTQTILFACWRTIRPGQWTFSPIPDQ